MNGFVNFVKVGNFFLLLLQNAEATSEVTTDEIKKTCFFLPSLLSFNWAQRFICYFTAVQILSNESVRHHYKQHVGNICGKYCLCWQRIVQKCAWVFQQLYLAFLSVELIFSCCVHGCSYGRELELHRNGLHNEIPFLLPTVRACSIFHLYCVGSL